MFVPLLALTTCHAMNAHPSDAQMLDEFAAQRPAFEQLLAMIRSEPHVTRVADDFIWIDGAATPSDEARPKYLSDGRWSRYRRLFSLLHLQSGVVKREDGSIAFMRSASGIVTSGSSKDFLWSAVPPAPLLARQSAVPVEDACAPKSGCSSYKSIEPHWSIAFDSN